MKIPLNDNNWSIEYDGYGTVRFEGGKLIMSPKASVKPQETHASLVLSDLKVRDFNIKMIAKTISQLRKNSPPNPWEVLWFFFNYIPVGNGKKQTNYFIHKTNGYEFGCAWGETDQLFISTGDNPLLNINRDYTYEILKSGSNFKIKIDGKIIFNESVSDDYFYNHYGYIGFYSEDAFVQVSSFEYSTEGI